MKKIITLLLFILFLATPLFSYADTTFNLSLTGGKKKEDLMSVSAVLKGGNCGEDTRQIVDIMLNGNGAGYPFAADFANSQISAALNGTPLAGSKRIFTNPPMIDSIVLHLDTPFTYDPKKDVVNLYVSNIRRGNVGGVSFDMYLLEHERTSESWFDACFTGNKYYNTKTPLADSELIAGDVAKNATITKTAAATVVKKASPSATLTPIPPTPTPTKAIAKKVVQKAEPKKSWLSLLISNLITIFRN
jgi:hypothetical protein